VQGSAASWRTSLQLRHMRSLLWGKVVETKLRDLDRAIKTFDTNQPRVPAGNPDGGQWTDGGGSGASSGGKRRRRSDQRWPQARQRHPCLVRARR